MASKQCEQCQCIKDLDEFYNNSSRSDGKQRSCKVCQAAYQKDYQKKRRERGELNHAELYRRRLQLQVLRHYGGEPPRCVCCGEGTFEFLTIDHENGGGSQHRREIGGHHNFLRWLKKNGFPKGFRILCHNCNSAHGRFGYCPHETGQSRGFDVPLKRTEQIDLDLLTSARDLAATGVYPSLNKLRVATGVAIGAISRRRAQLVGSERWPVEVATVGVHCPKSFQDRTRRPS